MKRPDSCWCRRLAVFAVVVCAVCLTPAVTVAQAKAFPSEWFWGNASQRTEQDALVGKPMPEFTLTDWKNGELKAEDLKGKIVVLDIWATWCGPCRAALPHNVELYNTYKDRGVVFVGVCGSSGQEKMDEILEENKVNYPSGRDSTGSMAEAWKVNWWPTYAIVDRSGIVRGIGLQTSSIEDAIKVLLAEEGGQAAASDAEVAATTSTTTAIPAEFLEGDAERRTALDRITGKAAPSLAAGTDWMNGEAVDFDALRGKVVVLDFWATWCGPCIASIPKNNEIAAKYGDQVVFIGVCHPRGVEKMASIASEKGIQYRLVADKEGTIIDAYNVDSFPDYYLIDKNGVLRIADCMNRTVEDAIKMLLAE